MDALGLRGFKDDLRLGLCGNVVGVGVGVVLGVRVDCGLRCWLGIGLIDFVREKRFNRPFIFVLDCSFFLIIHSKYKDCVTIVG